MLKKILSWFGAQVIKRPRKPGERCATCLHFEDYTDVTDEPGEVNGYCGHPNHSVRALSPHYEYGGHWTHSDSWCDWWEGKER